MVVHSVGLRPAPGITTEEIRALLLCIQELQGRLPGLTAVEVTDGAGDGRGEDPPSTGGYGFTFHFDTWEHLQAFNAHPAYQALRPELTRISPTTVVSGIQIRSWSVSLATEGPETPGN